jgi:hypothetical protein
MRAPKAIESPFEVSKFVGGEVPIFVLRGKPKPDVARLNRCNHKIADAWKIACRLGKRRRFRACGVSLREGSYSEADGHRGAECD